MRKVKQNNFEVKEESSDSDSSSSSHSSIQKKIVWRMESESEIIVVALWVVDGAETFWYVWI